MRISGLIRQLESLRQRIGHDAEIFVDGERLRLVEWQNFDSHSIDPEKHSDWEDGYTVDIVSLES